MAINAAPPPLVRPDNTPCSANRLEGAATGALTTAVLGDAPSKRASAPASGAAGAAAATGTATPEGLEDKRSPQ